MSSASDVIPRSAVASRASPECCYAPAEEAARAVEVSPMLANEAETERGVAFKHLNVGRCVPIVRRACRSD